MSSPALPLVAFCSGCAVSDDQFAVIAGYLANIQFLVTVVAFAACWSAGCQSLKFFLYVKNHKDIW